MEESPLLGQPYPPQNHRPPALGFLLLLSLGILLFLAFLGATLARKPDWFIGLALLILLWETMVLSGLFLIAWWHLSRPVQPSVLPSVLGNLPTMTVIIPAWNEAEALPHTLQSLLAQGDQPETIIVSDDGSTDESLERLKADYGLDFREGNPLGRSRRYPHLHVLRKPHGGKADSLNRAIAMTKDDVVMVLDADTRLYPGAIAAVRQAFAQDPHLHAVAGVPVPSCAQGGLGPLLQFFQRYEYMRGFIGLVGWNAFNSLTIISGACSAFRREVLEAVGGYDPNSWTEDCEIIFRLQAYWRSRGEYFRVKVDPRFLAQTDAPATLDSFLRQRRRWLGGFLETLVQYRHLVGDRHYGFLGLVYLTHATLAIMSPFIIAVGMGGTLSFLMDNYRLPDVLWMLVVGLWVYSTLMSYGRLALYESQIGRFYLSWPQMLMEILVAPWFYHPLMVIGHLWGYYSYWQRQKSW